MPPDVPLFSSLFVDLQERSLFEEGLNDNLAEPLEYLQAILSAAGQPVASLHSFTLSHHNPIKNQDLLARDQLVKLARLANTMLKARKPLVLN